MAENKKTPTVMENGKTVKVSMVALYSALIALAPNTTIGSIMKNESITKLLVAGKGGFNGEDSFVTIDGIKVARVCAMTGAVFAHDNTDKQASYFYKNGSYMIGAEVVKANARKAWEMDREDRLEALEDDMLEGTIEPKEWKEQASLIQAEEFHFELDEDTKADLIADFEGYATKEAFIEAYNAKEVRPFTDFDEEVKALRDLAPKRVEAETETEEA